MAHVKTNFGFWYPQNVSAGGDKVDAQKMFVDNIKLLDTMFKTAVMQHNSVSVADLDTIFDYSMYPVVGGNMVVTTANNIQVRYTANGVEVRTYNGSAWSNWFSDSSAAFNQANNAYNRANNAYNHANSAFNTANSAFNTANTVANVAQNAFNQANNAYNRANEAYNHANNAYSTANNAYSTANNAINRITTMEATVSNMSKNPILTAQSSTPTSVPAGRFIGVWEE